MKHRMIFLGFAALASAAAEAPRFEDSLRTVASDCDWDNHGNREYDPGGICIVQMTPSDWGVSDEAATAVGSAGGDCEVIADHLQGVGAWEWNGYYDYWDAWSDYSSQETAFQWEDMGDVGLWAHEGAHLKWNANETLAEHYQDVCGELW
jgi:hypothetical protein